MLPIRSPILLEINTRVWLRELSERVGRPLTLSEIPDSEMAAWRSLGFTHIWFMGVWQVGIKARNFALELWRNQWSGEFQSTEADVHGSPYAISEYAVDRRLGQPLDLLLLKERFSRMGLKLILDFVPNHLGIDSLEPQRYPARFVQAQSPREGTFDLQTKFGLRHFAHGRDPYFPPWQDTIQVDHRVAEAQDSLSALAQTISMFGHGLRCDMAMLVLPEIFNSVWKEFPSVGTHLVHTSLWQLAIPKIRELHPEIDLIAEVYWDKEAALQDAGFDYTYNKRVTDYLTRGQDRQLIEYLYSLPVGFLGRSVHFLENHDESRVAATLPFRRHKAAAALILLLPGMALIHEGQIEGRKRAAPIQMNRRPPEAVDRAVDEFYRGLFEAVQTSFVRRGVPELLALGRDQDAVVIRWTGTEGAVDFAVINLGRAPLRLDLSGHETSGLRAIYSTDGIPEIRCENSVIVPEESAHIFRGRTVS